MPQLDEYLRAVERGLRCPAERRPAIIEELRAHLRDRVEALKAQGHNGLDAERQATREMGPAWLLALRLSAANGWSLTAHIFREIWAAGIGTWVAAVGSMGVVFLMPRLMESQRAGEAGWTGAWVYLWVSYAVLLTAFPVFGFVVARLVRGWLWAMAPAVLLVRQVHIALGSGRALTGFAVGALFFLVFLVGAVAGVAVGSGARRESANHARVRARLTWLVYGAFAFSAVVLITRGAPRFEVRPGVAPLTLAALAFLLATAAGRWRESPRRTWLAWASGVLLVACGVGWPVVLPGVGLLNLPAGIADSWSGMPPRELIATAVGIALPWLFWVAAWLLDRHARGRLTGSAA